MAARDHLADIRHEGDIAEYAERMRNLAGIPARFPIDVICALNFLCRNRLPRKGQLEIVKSDHDEGNDPAFVTFDPLMLHVDRELWILASLGDPYCRFVLAHELGHILLHKNGMQPFSGKMRGFTGKGFQEQSAEWQANVFAYHFLTPDFLAKFSCDAHDLAKLAVIDADKAEQVLASLNRRRLWSAPRQTGEACSFCYNFSLKQNSLFVKCTTCGAQTFWVDTN